MAKTTIPTPDIRKTKDSDTSPLRLESLDEATAYLAKQLTPVGRNPSGHPIYAKKDIDSLNIILPEDD